MNTFEIDGHLADAHAFPHYVLEHDADTLRRMHERDHYEGGFWETLKHSHAEASV